MAEVKSTDLSTDPESEQQWVKLLQEFKEDCEGLLHAARDAVGRSESPQDRKTSVPTLDAREVM